MAMHIELPSGYEYKIQKTVLVNNSTSTINKKTQKPELLFTYVQMSHIIGAAAEGKTLGDLFPSAQPKKIELYDFEAKKDVLTDVNMITDLVGKRLLIGLQRKISNKVQKVGEGKDATWQDLPERRETLEFGCAGSIVDRRSFTEFNEGVAPEDAKDLDKWEKLNVPNGVGKDWNAYKEVAGTASGVPDSVATTTADQIHDFGT